MPSKAAAIPKALSTRPTLAPAAAARGAAAGRTATGAPSALGAVAATGREDGVPVGMAGGGGGGGVATGAAADVTVELGAAAVGILIVGAAVGLGGRLMRTVSFLG